MRPDVNVMYRMYLRNNGTYYCEDVATRSQQSLGTKDRHEAQRLLHAKNEAHWQPHLNLQLARTYLSASDPSTATRAWQDVMDKIVSDKVGPTRLRWDCAIRVNSENVSTPS